MNSRIPLIALLAVASFAARAGAALLPWVEGSHSARDWWAVEFEDETGETVKRYYVRSVDVAGEGAPSGSKIPLYILDEFQNPEVGLPYFKVRVGAYYLYKETANVGGQKVRRDGSELDAPARLPVFSRRPPVQKNFEMRIWPTKRPAGQTGDWSPAVPTIRIVVEKPSDDAKETLPPSILAGNDGRPVLINSGRLDGETTYPHYYKRTLPVQRVLAKVDPALACWPDPLYGIEWNGSRCVNREDIKKALDEAGDDRFGSLITLAVEGRKKGAERAQQIIAAGGPKTELTGDEMKTLRGLFALAPSVEIMTQQTNRFYERARAAQGDPIKRENFVTKWRGLIHEVLKEFIEHADAGRDETLYDRDLGSVREYVLHAFETPDAPEAEETPAANMPALALHEKERPWLTRVQAQAYDAAIAAIPADAATDARVAATKAAAAKARAEILANLEPKAEWVSRYKAAIEKPDATAGDVSAAVPAASEMWGGQVDAVVTAAGTAAKTNPDIQLTPEELEKLRANEAAFKAYDDVILRWGGASGPRDTAFKRDNYDPVALHNAVVAARKVIAGAPAAAAPPPAANAPLSPDERKLLTEAERTKYLADEARATAADASQGTKDGFARESARIRSMIASEGRKAGDPAFPPSGYTAANLRSLPKADFDKLPEWQKNKFCTEVPPASPAGAAGGSEPTRAAGLDTGRDANAGLTTSAAEGDRALAQGAAAGGDAGATATAWIETECGPRRVSLVTTPRNTGNGGTGTGSHAAVVPPIGSGKETPAKEPNKWLTQDLVLSGVKGGMIGLLVGSLFGPVGLIVGPIVGAAMFYGLTKLTSKE